MATTLSSDSSDLNAPLPPKPEKLCMDEMLQKYCGEFGRWQLKQFFLANLAWPLEAFHTMVMIFADHQPNWRCLPGAAGSGCYANAASVCHLKPGSWEWVGGHSITTVSEWDLICGNKYKIGLVQAMYFGGNIVGGGIFGHLSDSFLGRKGTLILACVLNAVFGCLTAISPKYWTYVLFRFLTGISNGGLCMNAFALATEPTGPTKRGIVGMCNFYFFSSGIALLSAIAYIFQKWRHLYIASSIPSLLYVLFAIPFISESPRWYLVRGKVTKAMKLMSTIASTNKKNLPSGIILLLDQEANDEKKASSAPDDKENIVPSVANDGKEASIVPNDGKGTLFIPNDGSSHDQNYQNESSKDKEAVVGSIVDVVRSPTTRIRLIITIFLSFFIFVVYFGLTLNVVNIRINLYLNVALNAVAELPAFVVTSLLLNKLGRKKLTVGTMWFSGFFCLIGSLMKSVGVWKVVRMVCGVLGIFGMAGTYNLLFIYVAELFPTVVRNVALGCTTQMSQMGAILAPFVVVLGGWLPFAVFAVCGILGGMFALLLPETMNMPLYDTIAGLEAGIV